MSKVHEYVNNNYDIGDEYFEEFNRSIPVGKMFCPFHANSDTPAAKRYGNHIQCFGTCKRAYTVYDFMLKYNPEKLEAIKSSVVFNNVTTSKKIYHKGFKVDRDLPIKIVINSILKHYEHGE